MRRLYKALAQRTRSDERALRVGLLSILFSIAAAILLERLIF